jgi:cystinosin
MKMGEPTADTNMSTNECLSQAESTHDVANEEISLSSVSETLQAQTTTASLRRALSLMASPILDESGRGESVTAGLFSLFLVGSFIGMIMPKNTILPTHWYQIISALIGWIYFLCWSISFYPQVISNFKRRTTQGLSADFCCLNVLGFWCYSVYNVAFFWSDTIHHLYRKRFGVDAEITVQSNDVAFALHAFLLSSITFLQIGCYNGVRAQRPSKAILAILISFVCVCAGYPCLIHLNVGGKNFFNWLDYLYVLSTIKITVSLIKYIPQGR